ncbi:inositol monophosphatase [Sulfitobacter albidus]|uniref:Inositol monophosphatase n=1 Tax=Sulfitobacter albidus TaxID=2829501 RepID=A0A975JE70_9RHOB|nr:inositol monophosphatase [Sulfitobacter albidus]QUJ76630.1 inositol monophosphatase [Sulfitobacter albidus]
MTDSPTDDLPAPLPPALTPAQRQNVVNIVRRAARAEIVPRFRRLSSGDIATKSSPIDLVTEADTRAEAMITRALQIAFPSALIVGEEACAKKPDLLDKVADAALAFIIDPVDGTWNFAHGLANFGVIVAATRFGKPVFGLIYDPMNDDWAIADEEMTPQMQRPIGAPKTLAAAPAKPLDEMTGNFPVHMFDKAMQPRLAALIPDFRAIVNQRSSAVEYRLLAQGHQDFALTALLHPWDHAAGALICQRAGCHVQMLDGEDYTAARHEGFLLVAPDKASWSKLKKKFAFLLEDSAAPSE